MKTPAYLAIAIALATAPLAKAQSYTCSVLYALPTPSGFQFSVTTSAGPDQTVGWGTPSGTFDNNALMWTSAGVTNINPAGYVDSLTYGASGGEIVGEGFASGNANYHAILWTNAGANSVDLNPTNLGYGVLQSHAFGTNGVQQVGDGVILLAPPGRGSPVGSHAILWTGNPASAVDLNPTDLTGITTSYADATDGGQQVGCGNYYPDDVQGSGIALLWSGTADSAVDLNPTNLTNIESCAALGVDGGEQVGYGVVSVPQAGVNTQHALLWTGTAASAVDLNPENVGTLYSEALTTNGIQQVGFGYNFDVTTVQYEDEQALLWSGTAASVVQLETFLPSTGTWTSSFAYTIDPAGNVYGTANGTFDGVAGSYAVEWSPVPEPASAILLLLGASGVLMIRNRGLIRNSGFHPWISCRNMPDTSDI